MPTPQRHAAASVVFLLDDPVGVKQTKPRDAR